MKKLIIANWKNHMTITEATLWVKNIRDVLEESPEEIVILPDYVCIPIVTSLLKEGSVKVGSQDISAYNKGSITGEVAAESLKGLVKYTLIGHSERRTHFLEDTELIVNKAIRSLECDLHPIVCFENLEELVSYKDNKGPLEVIFAYEDPGHIGTGVAVDPEGSKEILSGFRQIVGEDAQIVYGGSVDAQNARGFIDLGFDGLLVGSASLLESEFAKIVRSIE